MNLGLQTDTGSRNTGNQTGTGNDVIPQCLSQRVDGLKTYILFSFKVAAVANLQAVFRKTIAL